MLYFYPKDDTSGCTAEACAFRDALPDFSKAKADVIGISRNSVASHDKFKTKYGLTFPLASDEDGKVCEAYGTWVEKSMYGRKYMGIERSTFLIDAQGRDPPCLAQGEGARPRRGGAGGCGRARLARGGEMRACRFMLLAVSPWPLALAQTTCPLATSWRAGSISRLQADQAA